MDKPARGGVAWLLLFSVFIIATCGLAYELIASTLASYLLGDSVTQFSTIIGTYLFAMGVGSFLSRYLKSNLAPVFIKVELLIALLGGFSAVMLFGLFEWISGFRILLYGLVGIIGMLVGLEIPLLMRLLKDRFEFKDLVSQVFTFDYIGALLASLLFPLVLAPQLGLMRTALLFGIFNAFVALAAVIAFRHDLRRPQGLYVLSAVVIGLLIVGFIFADKIQSISEQAGYPQPIVYTKQSPYQRIILTQKRENFRLYLNGNLQFSSKDEYRYHEALVHPQIAALKAPEHILVLGGGDGLAVREILRYPSIKKVTLVDLDPEMTRLFQSHEALVTLNDSALLDPRITIIHQDAFQWILSTDDLFDGVIIDFPDPSNYSLGKLYSFRFYTALRKHLKPGANITIQSTSPLVARKSYWCVKHTLESAGFQVVPYHVYVPSFGEWGFLLAGSTPPPLPFSYPENLQYITTSSMQACLHFPGDMAELETDINRLNTQALVQYFEAEWRSYE
ncbi:MAG: polyamine aminopropyltransferase [Bacteroidia bacterium]